MTRFAQLLVLGTALVAAPAIAGPRDTPEVQLEKLLAGRVAGEPVNCISTFGTTSSTIIEGKAIVYRSGSKLYVNAPRSGASALNDDDVLVTKLHGSQLCSTDTVHLVDRASRMPGGFVLLGEFVPYTKAKQAN